MLALLAVAACSPFKLLRPNQRLLSRVEITGVKKPADQAALETLVQQRPNTQLPLPKLAIYQLGVKFYDSVKLRSKLRDIQSTYATRMQAAGTDSAKLGKLLTQRERKAKRKQLALDKGNAIMRLGEPPAIYDTALTQRSVQQMTTYLHTHGFFRGLVTATDTARYRRSLLLRIATAPDRLLPGRPDSLDRTKAYRRVTVTYRVDENLLFRYRLQPPSVADSGVAAVVRQVQPGALLRENGRYNEDTVGLERTRLETALKNAGYFDFRQQYISYEADTSYDKGTVRLRLLVANPAPGQGHRRYTVRQVRFITDAGVGRTLRNTTGDTLRRAGTAAALRARPSLGLRTDTTVTDSIHFAAYKQLYSTELLAHKVLVRPGQRYSLANTVQTQRRLADLDMFRFNTVNYRKVPDPPSVDSTALHPGTGELVAVINASPAPKYSQTSEVGGTYVAYQPGPFLNLRLKTRNPFGGAEVLEVGLRAGYEGQLTRVGVAADSLAPDAVYTTQLGATASLVLPQFLVPFRTNQFLTRYNPKTRFLLSETFVDRPEYARSNFEFSFDYIWQKSAFHQYVFSPVVITLVNSFIKAPSFQDQLDYLRITEGSSLYRSFSKQIEPSFSFTSLYNSNDFNQTRDAHYLRLFAELGGLTRSFYQDALKRNTGLNVYDFVRLSIDYRRYHHLTPQTYFVWRMNGGVVRALSRTYDDGTQTNAYIVPYDKSFFAGGSTSLRAWQPRRLGPGSFTPRRSDGSRDFLTEQPGELLLEGSVEYRFPISGFFKGALFTDFGNVWGLQERKDANGQYLRPGAQFQLNQFYRQIAVGSGFGVRFDFTFLILRLDIATKIYDPTAPGSGKWALRNFNSSANPISFNLGIGYPF